MSALNDKISVKENGESRMMSKREAAVKQIANKAAMGDLKSFKLLAELLDDDENREEQISNYAHSQSARNSLMKKLDDMAARIRARNGLPPEDKDK